MNVEFTPDESYEHHRRNVVWFSAVDKEKLKRKKNDASGLVGYPAADTPSTFCFKICDHVVIGHLAEVVEKPADGAKLSRHIQADHGIALMQHRPRGFRRRHRHCANKLLWLVRA